MQVNNTGSSYHKNNKVMLDYFFPFFLSGACVKAEAATLFTVFEDFGSLKSLPAFEATDFDVFSFFAIA